VNNYCTNRKFDVLYTCIYYIHIRSSNVMHLMHNVYLRDQGMTIGRQIKLLMSIH